MPPISPKLAKQVYILLLYQQDAGLPDPCCYPPYIFFVWRIPAGEENPGQDSGVEDVEGDQLHREERAIAPRGLPADGGPLAGADREPPD